MECLIAALNLQLFGRTVKASIASTTGELQNSSRRETTRPSVTRPAEIEKGYLSYSCPKNLLGEREPPSKKEKKKAQQPEEKKAQQPEEVEPEDIEDEGADPALDSLNQAIPFQQAHIAEERRRKQVTEDTSRASTSEDTHKPRIKKSTYFSDEEELSD